MAFPEFDDGKKKVLFFTRGRGRGHAIPDMEIAREIAALSGEIDVRFASYGTGARTFEAHGVAHVDLGLPDRNPINETIVLAGKLIGWLDPDLVVAHEEFMALSAAKIFDKPTVLITDWFTDAGSYSMSTLRLADRVVFLDEPGIYEEPEWVRGRVEYIGPVIRNLGYTRHDRARAREELGIERDALAIAVLPGSLPEGEAPIVDLVLAAFESLDSRVRRLIWAAGDDRDLIRNKTQGRAGVDVRGYEPEIGRIMAAADVAITKGTRKTLFELASLGVPSVSLAFGDNPIDRVRAGRFAHNEALEEGAGPAALANAVRRARVRDVEPVARGDAARNCARLLVESAGGAGGVNTR
jgi:UDP:flavonoid glycosyltransferase YjiC (YdhE family)